MDKIFQSLPSYNIINYLLPGSIFIFFWNLNFSYLQIDISKYDYVSIVFICYFWGLTISRIGSYLDDKLKDLNIVKKKSYDNYLKACRVDERIIILMEDRNLYRTMVVEFIILLSVSIVCNIVFDDISTCISYVFIFVYILLILLFFYSLRKQDKYINDRINFVLHQ